MNIYFIVTLYNVLPYVQKCLKSVADCTRPGDKILIIDDGSTDSTDAQLPFILSRMDMPHDVGIETILLPTNTIGGVGIPANIGLTVALNEQECDAIFFVDGDDWLMPSGFARARNEFERTHPDILIANYCEYDEQTESYHPPNDATQWATISHLDCTSKDSARESALRMISVPWRKFYSSAFLKAHHCRFPEGDFFFEDNPFHWEVCLKAEKILFKNQEICVHRTSRSGQTMASTGSDLCAFIDHYKSILLIIEEVECDSPHSLQVELLVWLLTNMEWHIERIDSTACLNYATRLFEVLKDCEEEIWKEGLMRVNKLKATSVAASLRRGEIAATATYIAQTSESRILKSQITAIENRLREQEVLLQTAQKMLSSHNSILRYEAISGLRKTKKLSEKLRAKFLK